MTSQMRLFRAFALQFVADDDHLQMLYTNEPIIKVSPPMSTPCGAFSVTESLSSQYTDVEHSYPHYPDVAGLVLSPVERTMYIDLRPYLNPTPHTVHVHLPVATAFQEFKALALRHMLVVNDCHDVVGIITRHDLLETNIEACVAQKDLRAAVAAAQENSEA
jgi:hypothetical protein